MTKLLLTCGVLAALTACATSQPAPSAAAGAAGTATPAATSAPSSQSSAAATPAKARLVCEETQQLGSHFQQRVCMTPEEAEARRKAAQEAMRNAQMMGAQCAQGQTGSCGGPPN